MTSAPSSSAKKRRPLSAVPAHRAAVAASAIWSDLPKGIEPPKLNQWTGSQKDFHTPFLYTMKAREAVSGDTSRKMRRPTSAAGLRSSLENTSPRVDEFFRPRPKSAFGVHGASEGDSERLGATMPSFASTRESTSSVSASTASGIPKPRKTLKKKKAKLSADEINKIQLEKDRLSQQIIDRKQIFNDLRAQSISMQAEYDRMLQESSVMEQQIEEQATKKELKLINTLQAVQTKMEYWTQCLKEEDLYKKTLDVMKERHLRQRQESEARVDELNKSLSKHGHDLHVLSVRLQMAKQNQQEAELACSEYNDLVKKYRQERDQRLSVRRGMVKGAVMRRHSAASSWRKSPSPTGSPHRGSRKGHGNAADEDSIEGESDPVAEGMKKLRGLTGQDTVEGICAAVTAAAEKRLHFENMIGDMKSRLDYLAESKASYESELSDVKYGGTDPDLEKQQIGEFANSMKAADRKYDKLSTKLDSMAKLVVAVNTGVEFLRHRLSSATSESDAIAMLHEQGISTGEWNGPNVLPGIAQLGDTGQPFHDALMGLLGCEAHITSLQLLVEDAMQAGCSEGVEEAISSALVADTTGISRPNNVRVDLESEKQAADFNASDARSEVSLESRQSDGIEVVERSAIKDKMEREMRKQIKKTKKKEEEEPQITIPIRPPR